MLFQQRRKRILKNVVTKPPFIINPFFRYGQHVQFVRTLDTAKGSSVVRFRDLQQFIRTKNAIDDSYIRQMILAQHYRPIKYLGKGRFGKVFLCEDESVATKKKQVAIKILNVERDRKEYNWTWLTAEERIQSQNDAKKLRNFIESLDPGLVKDHMTRAEQLMLDTMKREENPLLRKVRRPVAEREILVRIGPHPFVANLLTSFRDNRFMCLVFDYFPAGNLQKLIINEGRLPESVACFFGAQLLLALEFLHNKNVSHRDVKPSNILLSEDGHIALADFGLATRLRGGLKTFCGTAEYIAPEVLSEKMWSASGLDLWAFGITLYQLLVGKTPFEAPDATSVFLNTLTAPLIFPDFVSNEAKDLLKGLLNRDANARPTFETIKTHVLFKDINGEALEEKKFIPPKGDVVERYLINFRSTQQEIIKRTTSGITLINNPVQTSNISQSNTRRFDSLLK